MIVIAPLFGIAQMVYYFGIAEYMMGIDKSASLPTTALPAVKPESANKEKQDQVLANGKELTQMISVQFIQKHNTTAKLYTKRIKATIPMQSNG